jgi:hypothetical protein
MWVAPEAGPGSGTEVAGMGPLGGWAGWPLPLGPGPGSGIEVAAMGPLGG